MAEAIEGMNDLVAGLGQLPDRMQRSVVRAWALKWSRQAYMAVVAAAPRGKTGNLIAGIKRRNASKQHLARIGSLARAVVIGAKPAYHYHIVNIGTGTRFTGMKRSRRGGRSVSRKRLFAKQANRGAMPANKFVERAAAGLMESAEQDLAKYVQRALARVAKRGG